VCIRIIDLHVVHTNNLLLNTDNLVCVVMHFHCGSSSWHMFRSHQISCLFVIRKNEPSNTCSYQTTLNCSYEAKRALYEATLAFIRQPVLLSSNTQSYERTRSLMRWRVSLWGNPRLYKATRALIKQHAILWDNTHSYEISRVIMRQPSPLLGNTCSYQATRNLMRQHALLWDNTCLYEATLAFVRQHAPKSIACW
jgi:hypothetical protein